MQAILIVASAAGLILGSLTTAGLLCWLMWDAGKLFRHPEWVAWAILAFLFLSLAGKFPNSEFAHLVLMFALVAILPLWFAGRAWRTRQLERTEVPPNPRSQSAKTEPDVLADAPSGHLPYPAITDCLSAGRSPTRDERNLLASRFWREALEKRFGSELTAASFANRRILSRATKAALQGTAER